MHSNLKGEVAARPSPKSLDTNALPAGSSPGIAIHRQSNRDRSGLVLSRRLSARLIPFTFALPGAKPSAMQSSAVAATMLRLEQPSTDATCKQRRMLVLSMNLRGCTVKLCSGGYSAPREPLRKKLPALTASCWAMHACCRKWPSQ